MSKICNNIDGKCYIFEDENEDGIKSSVNLNNDICNSCYMPTSCPQNSNSQYQWIFNIPDPYASQLEFYQYL